MSKRFPTLFAHLFPPRFSGKFYVDGDSGCWVWTAAHTCGYGQLTVNGVNTRAHRYSYAYANNKAESELGPILHSCDNRACVNPEHLREGTISENNDERYTRTGGYKLRLDQVREIRERAEEGTELATLAAVYDISLTHICEIVRGAVWSKYL